jgi:hypothetical protein
MPPSLSIKSTLASGEQLLSHTGAPKRSGKIRSGISFGSVESSVFFIALLK